MVFFSFFFFFHFKLFLFLISISVAINDFEILASSSEIIIKSSCWSSFGWPIFVVGSGFLNESNSSSSIKKSSVFGTRFGIIYSGVGWIFGCFIIFLNTVLLSWSCSWGGRSKTSAVFWKFCSLGFNWLSIKRSGVGSTVFNYFFIFLISKFISCIKFIFTHL